MADKLISFKAADDYRLGIATSDEADRLYAVVQSYRNQVKEAQRKLEIVEQLLEEHMQAFIDEMNEVRGDDTATGNEVIR